MDLRSMLPSEWCRYKQSGLDPNSNAKEHVENIDDNYEVSGRFFRPVKCKLMLTFTRTITVARKACGVGMGVVFVTKIYGCWYTCLKAVCLPNQLPPPHPRNALEKVGRQLTQMVHPYKKVG
jgi:hypothetical protein